jgi:hypothetical protein
LISSRLAKFCITTRDLDKKQWVTWRLVELEKLDIVTEFERSRHPRCQRCRPGKSGVCLESCVKVRMVEPGVFVDCYGSRAVVEPTIFGDHYKTYILN